MSKKPILLTPSDIDRVAASRLLENLSIQNTEMSGYNLNGLYIVNCEFNGVGMSGCSVAQGGIIASTMTGVSMRGSDFNNAKFIRSIFSHSMMIEASFTDSEFSECSFTEANMANSDFSRCELSNLVFRECDMYGVKFNRSVIVKSAWSNRRLGNAVLTGADFSEAILVDCDLSTANLSGANFRNSLLVRVSMSDANLINCDFSGARLLGCSAVRADIDSQTRAYLESTYITEKDSSWAIIDFLSKHPPNVAFSMIASLIKGYVLGTNIIQSVELPPLKETPKSTHVETKPAKTFIEELPEVKAPKQDKPKKKGTGKDDLDFSDRFGKIEID